MKTCYKIIVILIIFFSETSLSQKPNFYGTFDFIADNREYFSQYAYPQTILGGRVDLKAEFEIDTLHNFYLGANYLFEFGHTLNAHKPVPDMYYQFENNRFKLLFGSFPRYNNLNYPLVLLTDTLNYYRPNIQGALAQVNLNNGFENLWIDWTSRQTDTIRETFLAGISGKFDFGIFYFENYFYMYHYAGPKIRLPGIHIRDNGGGAVHAGLNLSESSILNILNIDVGLVSSYDRERPDPYVGANGFIGRICAQYKRIGTKIVTYYGDQQYLAYGDFFYSGGRYSRIDLYFIPIKTERIDSKIIFGMHFAEDDFNQSQQILIKVDFLK